MGRQRSPIGSVEKARREYTDDDAKPRRRSSSTKEPDRQAVTAQELHQDSADLKRNNACKSKTAKPSSDPDRRSDGGVDASRGDDFKHV